MYKKQHKAGYFLNSIFDLFINDAEKQKIKDIVDYLCYFNLETSESIEHIDSLYVPEIKIVNNLISRGFPNSASVYIEDILSGALGYNSKKINEKSEISYPFNDDELLDSLNKALHIIDPRITKDNQTDKISDADWKDKNKSSHLNFKYSFIPEYLGSAFIQLIDNERTYESFIKSSNYKGSKFILHKKYGKILQNKCDFALEMPYPHQNSKGITVQIDENPSNSKFNYEIESIKRDFCKELQFSTPLFIDNQDNEGRTDMMRPLVGFTYNDYFDNITKNYRSPLYNTELGIDAMQYALSPLAVARIEKTVIEYLLAGKLNLLDQQWKIAVIERDIPCAHLAFQDLKLHFENIFALKGDKFKFPEINLQIYKTPEFSRARLNSVYSGKIDLLENFNEKEKFDLLIDVSVIQRSGIFNDEYETAAKNIAIIRSVRQVENTHNILIDRKIEYKDFISYLTPPKVKDAAQKAVKFFLYNIFRQENFTSQQLELTNKILQGKNTLGMLPTSQERNMTYQLAGMLQAGVNIIISPLRSVMLERLETMQKYGLDNAVILHKGIHETAKLYDIFQQILNGEYQFVFVVAEFLHDKQFRKVLRAMPSKKTYINQFVIDEAHCLSEFSHDFRAIYYELGKIKKLLLSDTLKQNINTVALSSIASYTVVSDILDELSIAEADVVKDVENKAKIKFQIIDTSSNEVKSDMDINRLRNVVRKTKQAKIIEVIKEQYRSYEENENTLLYCSDTYGKSYISGDVKDGITDELCGLLPNVSVGHFLGSKNDNSGELSIFESRKSDENFVKFLNNELDVLVSNEAFGIGVNKTDISHITYFNTPFSTESFIQQIKEVGCKEKPADCILPIDNKRFIVPKQDPILEYLKTNECSYDKYIAYKSILSKYKGRKKEISIIKELLYDIKPLVLNYKDLIKSELQREYGVNAELELIPKDNPNKLYINEQNKTHGYINLDNLTVFCKDSNFNQNQSIEMAMFVADAIEKRKSINEKYSLLLQQKIDKQFSKGIVADCKNLKQNDIVELSIPYENSAIRQITLKLKEVYPSIFSENLVRNLYKNNHSAEAFWQAILDIKKIDRKKLRKEVADLYASIRIKEDTLLAIHRLMKLGIIKDFVADDLNHTFVVSVKKPEKDAILARLTQIFETYLLNEKLKTYKKDLGFIGNDFIDDSVKLYIDFCYEFIISERIKSIDNLHKILAELAENKVVDSVTNDRLKLYFDNYLTERYSTPFSVSSDENFMNQSSENISYIEKNLDKISDFKEDWLQLKKSAQNLSKNGKNNYVAQLVDAHTELILGENTEDVVELSLDKAASGLIKMRQANEFHFQNYINEIKQFIKIIDNVRPDLTELYENILWLKIHRVWLTEYRKRND